MEWFLDILVESLLYNVVVQGGGALFAAGQAGFHHVAGLEAGVNRMIFNRKLYSHRKLDIKAIAETKTGAVHDRAQVYVTCISKYNRETPQYIATINRWENKHVNLPNTQCASANKLLILVENMGRVNYGQWETSVEVENATNSSQQSKQTLKLNPIFVNPYSTFIKAFTRNKKQLRGGFERTGFLKR
ncbi:hypothetical protein LXL04_007465 [Taraxacum kok-saghyz]